MDLEKNILPAFEAELEHKQADAMMKAREEQNNG